MVLSHSLFSIILLLFLILRLLSCPINMIECAFEERKPAAEYYPLVSLNWMENVFYNQAFQYYVIRGILMIDTPMYSIELSDDQRY